ncbi:MAG: WcaI family glycosyltransferase, partial [Chloroflexota bacterium]
MRILIVGINFHPELTGIGKYTGEMASFFAEQGSDVHVVTAPPYYPQWEVQSGYYSWWYQQEFWQAVNVFRCPIWVPRKPTGITRLIHLLSFALSSFPVILGQCLWKPDLVLCVAPTLFNSPSVILMARLCAAKTWLHIQDFELDAASNMGMLSGHNLFSKVAGGVERWLLKQFDQISTISNQMLARIESKGIAPGKYFLFPNWVDTGLIHPLSENQDSVKKELQIPENKTIVLYSGNMGHKQGLENVIKAARHLKRQKNIHFVLCGDGAVRT